MPTTIDETTVHFLRSQNNLQYMSKDSVILIKIVCDIVMIV